MTRLLDGHVWPDNRRHKSRLPTTREIVGCRKRLSKSSAKTRTNALSEETSVPPFVQSAIPLTATWIWSPLPRIPRVSVA